VKDLMRLNSHKHIEKSPDEKINKQISFIGSLYIKLKNEENEFEKL
jgi:hypothetical protein